MPIPTRLFHARQLQNNNPSAQCYQARQSGMGQRLTPAVRDRATSASPHSAATQSSSEVCMTGGRENALRPRATSAASMCRSLALERRPFAPSRP